MTEWLLTSSRRRRHPASQSKKIRKEEVAWAFSTHFSMSATTVSLSFLGILLALSVYIFTQRLLLDLFPCRCLIFSLALRRLSPLSQFIAPSTLLGLYNSICVTVGFAIAYYVCSIRSYYFHTQNNDKGLLWCKCRLPILENRTFSELYL